MKLSSNDLARLKRVHPDLVKVIKRAASITNVPFEILQADRTVAQQQENVKHGVSQTMHSRHLIDASGLVYAVDVAPLVGGEPSFSWPVYYKLAPIIKQAARDVGVMVQWGGDWKKFKDGPHWQLPWGKYPAKE